MSAPQGTPSSASDSAPTTPSAHASRDSAGRYAASTIDKMSARFAISTGPVQSCTKLAAPADAELAVDGREQIGDRVSRRLPTRGDGSVGQPFGCEQGHLALGRREVVSVWLRSRNHAQEEVVAQPQHAGLLSARLLSSR